MNMSSYSDLINILKRWGIESISKSEGEALFRRFANNENAENELEFILFLNKAMITSYSKVTVTNMLQIYKNIDGDLLRKLYGVYEEIKDKSIDELDSLRKFEQIAKNILAVNNKVNEEIAQMANDAFKRSVELRNSFYLIMSDKDKADEAYENCCNRSKVFIRQCECAHLEELLLYLKRYFSFSDDELVNISSKCSTFFALSSASKIDGLYRSIEQFRNFIKDNIGENQELSKLLAKDFKDIISGSSSIGVYSVSSVDKTIRFLCGEKLGDLAEVPEGLRNIRGNFTPVQLAKIYNDSITSIGVSVEKVAAVYLGVARAYKEAFKRDIDIDNLINGRNFSSLLQLDKVDYSDNNKLDEIFKMLSMFFSADDMESLLKNNMGFLSASVDDVRKGLQEAILTSSDEESAKKNVMKMIRSHFDRRSKELPVIRYKTRTGISVGGLHKVTVKSMGQDDMAVVLASLQVDADQIASWKKKWEEEEEYKNLEVLETLEEIEGDLEDIEEMSAIYFESVEQFLAEVMLVKGLFDDVYSRFLTIMLSEESYSEEVKTMIDTMYSRVDLLSNRINNNIQIVIDRYSEEVAKLNSTLSEKNAKMKKIDSDSDELDDLLVRIRDEQITEENIKEFSEFIDTISKEDKDTLALYKKIHGEVERAGEEQINEFVAYTIRTYKGKDFGEPFNPLDPTPKICVEFMLVLDKAGVLDYQRKTNFGTEDIPREDIPSYEVFRKKLDTKQREITDVVYELFKNKEEWRLSILRDIRELFKSVGRDASVIKDDMFMEEASAQVRELIKAMKQTDMMNRAILSKRDRLLKRDFEGERASLSQEIETLSTQLNEYLGKIENLKKEKINIK